METTHTPAIDSLYLATHRGGTSYLITGITGHPARETFTVEVSIRDHAGTWRVSNPRARFSATHIRLLVKRGVWVPVAYNPFVPRGAARALEAERAIIQEHRDALKASGIDPDKRR